MSIQQYSVDPYATTGSLYGHGDHGGGSTAGSMPIFTDDASTKLSERVRRRCFNCSTTDTSTWRRSGLNPGKVLCNKCGLFERTHSRPRPNDFPYKLKGTPKQMHTQNVSEPTLPTSTTTDPSATETLALSTHTVDYHEPQTTTTQHTDGAPVPVIDPGSSPSLPSDGVYGSLDPPVSSQKSSKPGWRYIQCTNTRDELRVLLPPRPATIYTNLLKVEADVLTKNDADSLRDLQYIRYLKDTMVKRCRKLAEDVVEHRSVQNMSVIEAPLHFKLKRLEQWWRSIEAQRKTQNYCKSDQERAERSNRMQARISAVTTSSSSDSEYSAKLSLSSASHGSSEQRGRSSRQWRPKGKLTKLQTISAATDNSIKKKPSVSLSIQSVEATISSNNDSGWESASEASLKSVLRLGTSKPLPKVHEEEEERSRTPDLSTYMPSNFRMVKMDRAFYEGFVGRSLRNIPLFEMHHCVSITIHANLDDDVTMEIEGDPEHLNGALLEIELLRRYRAKFGSTLFHPQPDEEDIGRRPLPIPDRTRRESSLSSPTTPLHSATPKSMSTPSSLRSVRSVRIA